MAFWGVELKPESSYTHVRDSDRGKLRITQAILGNGTGSKRTVVMCNVGGRGAVILCSLVPDKSESCSLDLEFNEESEVIFSVDGTGVVHLSGYYCGHSGDGNSTDSYGEDITEQGSDESVDFDSEEDYDEDFIDDGDVEVFPPSPKTNSGVVIEEILDDEEPIIGHRNQVSRKKKQVINSDNDDGISEDRGELPISPLHSKKSSIKDSKKNKRSDENKQGKKNAIPNSSDSDKKVGTTTKKKKTQQTQVENTNNGLSDQCEMKEVEQSGNSAKKKNKKKKNKETKMIESHPNSEVETGEKKDEEKAAYNSATISALEDSKIKKKNKKKRNKAETSSDIEKLEDGNNNQSDSNIKPTKKQKKKATNNSTSKNESSDIKADKEKPAAKDYQEPCQTRTFPNGLTIEELTMGQPDGKRATKGNKVSVHYIGKLKNGTIFDSCIGKRPFQFRLGNGQVIKGWDVGVNGMRVGEKRRLTVPPSMGYGNKNMGKIPANSTLTFDVELVSVK
ncbi:Peptidyl-prolyl cis-trans isomerase [Zostera marina]|uniref:peptidylprolyl isomerase n=1 Tax=Zostera marina TaxID=29655 RepID=A0A0K9P1Y7_ZOSMR|nr:Peptidyl-prolyl cis-trans isomerase [Zostera marina]